MVKHNKDGAPLWKRLTVALVFLDESTKKHVVKAPPGKAFTAEGIDGMLEKFEENIDRLYPALEWRLVELAPNWFKLICVKEKGASDEGTDTAREASAEVGTGSQAK